MPVVTGAHSSHSDTGSLSKVDFVTPFSLLTSSSCIVHPVVLLVPVQAVQVMRLWLAGGDCKGRFLGPLVQFI